MRNKYEAILKEMQGNLFHIRVGEIFPHPSNKEWVRIEIIFLEGPLSEEYYSINVRTHDESTGE